MLTYDVVTCGFASAPMPWLDRDGVAGLPEPGAPGFLDAAFTALDGLEPDRRVLLLHASGAAATHHVRLLRAALRNPFVVPLALPVPVSGLASIAAWLGALAERGVGAGHVVAGLREIADHLPSYVVTTSVAGLEMPEVRLRHHLLSWLPGTTFGIALGAQTVVEVGSLADPRAWGTGPATVVWAGDRRLAVRLGSDAGERPTGTELVELPAAAAADADGDRWPRTRFYEHCVVPHDVDDFAARLRAAELARCAHCGESTGRVCSFCLSQEGALA